MANVIKHKRGSGSDPVASDLVVGEVAIRTDVGKLFTKMDNGSVAEIAGGGSDIAINTLSSSSATGGGSATFNGSAYRFTLSQPPSVSAQQLLVSINGVIQKPVAGTGQPSEGFSVDGTDIILGDAPATGSDFFILTFKSLGVSEPADNSVTSAKIVDGTIDTEDLGDLILTNAKVATNAAIAGTKISPNFGSQNISTTGSIGIGTTSPRDKLEIKGANAGYSFRVDAEAQIVKLLSSDNTGATQGGFRFCTDNSATEFERMRIDTSGNVGIGTTSPAYTNALFGGSQRTFHLSGTAAPQLRIQSSTSGQADLLLQAGNSGSTAYIANAASGGDLFFSTNNGGSQGTRFVIKDDGKVGIGTTSPGSELHVSALGASDEPTIRIASENSKIFLRTAGSSGAFPTGGGGDDGELTYIGGNFRLGIGTASKNLIFFNGSGYTERMRLDSSGRLHIGTATNRLGETLHVLGNGIVTSSAENTNMMIFGTFGGSNALIGSFNSIPLIFRTGNTERMRIDSSGRVLIGTTSGSDALVVDGGSDAGTITTNSTNSNGNMMTFQCSGTSKFFIGSAGSFITGNSGTTNQGIRAEGALLFAAGGHTERMRISSSGRVFIGTTSGNGILNVSGNASTNETLILNDTNNTNSHTHRISFKTGGTEVGKITSNRSATLYVTSSDYRLKENVVNISDGITRLKKLLPKRFNWINDETNTLVDGFLAHEVSDAVPEAISGTKDEVDENNEPVYQGIDQSKLVPLLVAALQEAIGRIEVLEAK